MKELVVISGKGGTGKTSLVASFAALANKAVLADCDVDAADLALVLAPDTKRRENFLGGKKARVMAGHCVGCGVCDEVCVFDAVFFDGPGNGAIAKTFRVDPIACEGCGVCAWFCPVNAIEYKQVKCGVVFESQTRFGPMSHARLDPGEENSGKLVTVVRTRAKEIAEREERDLIIVDGSPGIGCAVIASLTGVDLALAVTEPTVSGLHDLERVARLAADLEIELMVCVNKHDLNADKSVVIESYCEEHNIALAGRVRYTPEFTKAMIAEKPLVEHTNSPAVDDVCAVWEQVSRRLYQSVLK